VPGYTNHPDSYHYIIHGLQILGHEPNEDS
jgi:hypothetical protein